MGRLIVDLKSRRALREPLAGGKGARLAGLARAGFPVPPGFIITTAVFRGALTAAVRRIASESGAPDLENLEAIRDTFLSWDIVPAHRRAILRAYRKLGGPVAVRSSMVGQDSKAASMTGQTDAVLGVAGDDEVLAAVKKCLAAAFGARLWTDLYHKEAGPAEPMSMAVIVHAVINAVVCGGALTSVPVSGKPSLMIEAGPGSGDQPCPGGTAIECYTVGATGELSGPRHGRGGAALLEEARILELAALVQEIAGRIGGAQDVDWIYDGRRFYILDSRPVAGPRA